MAVTSSFQNRKISNFRSSFHAEVLCETNVFKIFAKFLTEDFDTDIFCEFCKIFKSSFFGEDLRVIVSKALGSKHLIYRECHLKLLEFRYMNAE